MRALLLHKWKFYYGECPEAWYMGYRDDTWQEVGVPHDWSVHMPFLKENSSGTGYLSGGIGWYRTSFRLPEKLRGKRIFITCDGIYKNSQLWCNSYYFGKRPFGYSTFRYDITEQAKFGDESNVIAIKVSHPDIADSRWFTGSGITRKVTVHAEESVHPQFQGIFFRTPAVSGEKAGIETENLIKNDSSHDVTVTVKNTLSYQGKEVLAMEGSMELPAGAEAVLTNHGTLAEPALWSPEMPQLYKLITVTSSESADGLVRTQMENARLVGIRSIEFDPDKGFFLNKQAYKLKGVCVHHDAGCLGAAVLPEVWERRLHHLKEMGCNAIRMSHNPHMPELYDLCDRIGFLVMDEAFDEWEGPKNKWSTGHNVYPPKHQGYYEDFPEWHERDLSDLIKRDRNHPCIFSWSIGNEIDYPNDPYCHPLFETMTGNNDKNKPVTERQYNSNKPNAERLSVIARSLVRIVKQHDTTRPVTAAVAFPELSTRIGYIDDLDIVGYNYKEQFYEQDHARFPGKPFLGSENSHSYSAWKAVRDQEYISGQFLWTGVDYLGEAHGWPIHGSGAGLLTLAGFPKTSYYRRQSFWSEAPVLYLAAARTAKDGAWYDGNPEWKPMSRSWNYVPGEEVEVRCYTNLPHAELFCNRKSHGIGTFSEEYGYISWIIPYEAGEVTALGYKDASDGTVAAHDTVTTTGRGCQIVLKPWASPVSLCGELPITDAEPYPATVKHTLPYLKQIEVTITDEEGRWVTSDSTMLFVKVTGAGRLTGLENGDLSDVTEYSAEYRRAYEGRLLIYVACEDPAQETTVSVRGQGLKPAAVQLL